MVQAKNHPHIFQARVHYGQPHTDIAKWFKLTVEHDEPEYVWLEDEETGRGWKLSAAKAKQLGNDLINAHKRVFNNRKG